MTTGWLRPPRTRDNWAKLDWVFRMALGANAAVFLGAPLLRLAL